VTRPVPVVGTALGIAALAALAVIRATDAIGRAGERLAGRLGRPCGGWWR